MKPYSRVYATVNLDAIEENMKAMRARMGTKAALIGVVKADGYGHGAVPVARTIAPYVEAYAVATVDEGIQLRDHGIEKPVIILGAAHHSRCREILEYDLSPAVFTEKQARELSETSLRVGKTAKIQVVLDTGMGRIGWQPNETSADEVCLISRLPGIEVAGMFTHFARADEWDQSFTRLQKERYLQFVEYLKDRQVQIPVMHCANSAGLMALEGTDLDAVRAGIIIYGLYPSEQVDKEAVKLTPAMELKSFIVYVKDVEAGTPISYGGTFVAQKPMRVATVPVGYADGYPRNLSGKGTVLARGARAAILGRVCMDQLMIDVTDIPEAAEDDEVTLIGRDGDEMISMEEVAEACGGFHYEIPCVLGRRVPRVYIRRGQIVGTKDWSRDRYEDFT